MTAWIRELGHGFAGQVMGVNCRKPLSSVDVAAIHAGMNDYAVLVFRDQKLSDEEQLRFTLHFGTLEETRGLGQAMVNLADAVDRCRPICSCDIVVLMGKGCQCGGR